MKQTKQDKQFMIQFDQTNRDFLMNMSMFLLSMLMSVTALVVAVFSIVYSITGFSTYSIIVLIIFCLILIPFWIKFLRHAKKGIKDSKKVDEQLQGILFKTYPEYKQKIH
jgi:membrane protein implicated in regulation of membrane protease activity